MKQQVKMSTVISFCSLICKDWVGRRLEMAGQDGGKTHLETFCLHMYLRVDGGCHCRWDGNKLIVCHLPTNGLYMWLEHPDGNGRLACLPQHSRLQTQGFHMNQVETQLPFVTVISWHKTKQSFVLLRIWIWTVLGEAGSSLSMWIHLGQLDRGPDDSVT